jgi:hypothetical protein
LDFGGFFSSPKVFRGLEGQEFSKARPNTELANLLLASDSATVHYTRFAGLNSTADLVSTLGGLAILTGAIGASLTGDEFLDSPWGGVAAIGFVIGSVGSVVRKSALNRLERSIWWYNGTLER